MAVCSASTDECSDALGDERIHASHAGVGLRAAHIELLGCCGDATRPSDVSDDFEATMPIPQVHERISILVLPEHKLGLGQTGWLEADVVSVSGEGSSDPIVAKLRWCDSQVKRKVSRVDLNFFRWTFVAMGPCPDTPGKAAEWLAVAAQKCSSFSGACSVEGKSLDQKAHAVLAQRAFFFRWWCEARWGLVRVTHTPPDLLKELQEQHEARCFVYARRTDKDFWAAVNKAAGCTPQRRGTVEDLSAALPGVPEVLVTAIGKAIEMGVQHIFPSGLFAAPSNEVNGELGLFSLVLRYPREYMGQFQGIWYWEVSPGKFRQWFTGNELGPPCSLESLPNFDAIQRYSMRFQNDMDEKATGRSKAIVDPCYGAKGLRLQDLRKREEGFGLMNEPSSGKQANTIVESTVFTFEFLDGDFRYGLQVVTALPVLSCQELLIDYGREYARHYAQGESAPTLFEGLGVKASLFDAFSSPTSIQQHNCTAIASAASAVGVASSAASPAADDRFAKAGRTMHHQKSLAYAAAVREALKLGHGQEYAKAQGRAAYAAYGGKQADSKVDSKPSQVVQADGLGGSASSASTLTLAGKNGQKRKRRGEEGSGRAKSVESLHGNEIVVPKVGDAIYVLHNNTDRNAPYRGWFEGTVLRLHAKRGRDRHRSIVELSWCDCRVGSDDAFPIVFGGSSGSNWAPVAGALVEPQAKAAQPRRSLLKRRSIHDTEPEEPERDGDADKDFAALWLQEAVKAVSTSADANSQELSKQVLLVRWWSEIRLGLARISVTPPQVLTRMQELIEARRYVFSHQHKPKFWNSLTDCTRTPSSRLDNVAPLEETAPKALRDAVAGAIRLGATGFFSEGLFSAPSRAYQNGTARNGLFTLILRHPHDVLLKSPTSRPTKALRALIPMSRTSSDVGAPGIVANCELWRLPSGEQDDPGGLAEESVLFASVPLLPLTELLAVPAKGDGPRPPTFFNEVFGVYGSGD